MKPKIEPPIPFHNMKGTSKFVVSLLLLLRVSQIHIMKENMLTGFFPN